MMDADTRLTINNELINHEPNTLCYKFNESNRRKEILFEIKISPKLDSFLETWSKKPTTIVWGEHVFENMELTFPSKTESIFEFPKPSTVKVTFKSTTRFI